MLGGQDPIIIFEFYKSTVAVGSDGKIPVAGQKNITFTPLPPVPLYLNEQLTGLYIDKADKSIDIGTDTETFINGTTPDMLQKGIASTVKITMNCKKDSVTMMILSATIDLIFDKVTSKEYAITFLFGATTIFRGVMHSFSISQTAQTDLMEVNIELSRGFKQPTPATTVPVVPASLPSPIPVGA